MFKIEALGHSFRELDLAAVAAAIGVGAISDWSEIERFVIPGDTVDPEPTLVERYDEAYALWREQKDVTATTMRALARR